MQYPFISKLKLNHSITIGSLSICLAATLWGLDGIVLTPRLYNLDISLVVFLIHLVPFILMQFFFLNEYKALKTLDLKNITTLFFIALFGGAIGTLSMVKALFLVNFESLTIVVLLQKLQPVFALALAAIFLKERLKFKSIIWAILAICAGYFLTFGFNFPNINTNANTIAASLYSLLAAASFGSATVLSKSVLNKISFKSATFYRYGFTTLIMFIIVIFTNKLNYIHNVTTDNIIVIFIIAITTGSAAIFLYYYGLNRVKAMVATICELCFPLSAIIFDYAFNGKLLTTTQWISAFIMLFAIIKLSISKN